MHKIINVTPHAITFVADPQNPQGDIFSVPPNPEDIITARAIETPAGTKGGVTLVRTTFTATPEAEAILARLEAANPDAIIVGSIIAAQAFPGRVLAMVPAKGFERVEPSQKRMDPSRFTTF